MSSDCCKEEKSYYPQNSYEMEKLDNETKVKVQTFIDTIMNPIIKAQKAPKINLQWLFNWKYEKRFNE